MAAEYGVVIVRNQAMTIDQQAVFAHTPGVPLTTPINKNDLPRELVVIKANDHSKRTAEEGLDSDESNDVRPSGLSILRMEIVSKSG